MQTTLADAAGLLLAAEDILVLSHQFPDGDTLGCASALCRALLQRGKRVCFRCSDGIPNKYSDLFHGLADCIEPAGFSPQFLVSVDVADESLLGKLRPEYAGRIDLCIDHHGTNQEFAQYSYVDSNAAATAEILYRLMPLLGAEIDAEMAGAIYTGITTDTGCFRYRNTTPDSYRIAAEMIERGADAPDINFRMFELKSRSRLELERMVLDSAEFFGGDRGALILITRDMVARSNAAEEDLDGISAMPRRIEGVLVGITMREKADGSYKISMRTNPPLRACDICAVLGGGGHPGAAGCAVEGPLEKAKQTVVAVANTFLDEAARN